MKKLYFKNIISSVECDLKHRKSVFSAKVYIAFFAFFLFLAEVFSPSILNAQNLDFSYSYVNITRGTGGGTLEKGDEIEVRALVKVNKTTKNFYYIDTIRKGTQYKTSSLKILTNEGLAFRSYTDKTNDDAGVYDASSGIGRIRINLGTGAAKAQTGTSFGSTTGGGTVNPSTDKPKFYGATLFVVAYRLIVTADPGDTIYLTGNYYFENTTYRFNYNGIKINKNQGLCNNFSSASFSADSSFGKGNVQNRALPAIVPGYTKVNLDANGPQDNYYAIVNNTSANGTVDDKVSYNPNAARVFGLWDIIGDHTGAVDPILGNPPTPKGAEGGYMLVVNSNYPTGEAYRETIKNVCPDTYYEFSAWIRNICGKCSIDSNSTQQFTKPGVLPNLAYAINDVDYYTTGNIAYDKKWQKRGFIYKTGPNETEFVVSIKNNAPGGGGNDWVIDDIKLTTCYPNLIMNPMDTAQSCAGDYLLLSDTVRSYFNNYINFCWEKSVDGNNWISTGNCGSKTPVLKNGLWEYVIDTAFKPTIADSGIYYRVKVATSTDNITDSKCAVNNSQKVFLKVFTEACQTLGVKSININGKIINNKSWLQWVSKSEENLKEYEIEKSYDGTHFKKVGNIKAFNDRNESVYTFNDPEIVSNLVYYRLKLINKDLVTHSYSKTIVLQNRNASFKITTANPFKNNLKIGISLPEEGMVEFKLLDVFGKIIRKKNVQLNKGNSQTEIENISNLPAGIYILSANNKGNTIQYKLIKTN